MNTSSTTKGGRSAWVVLGTLGLLALLTLVLLLAGLSLLTGSPEPPAVASDTPTEVPAQASPAPSAAATALPPLQFTTTVYTDSFDSAAASAFTDARTDSATFSFEQGGYAIEVAQQNFIVWSPFPGTYANASVSFDLAFVGEPTNVAAGLIFDYQDENNYYFFNISADGRYALDARRDGRWISLIEWTKWPAIKLDGSANHLRVETERGTIRMYLDDRLLDEAVDDTFNEGGMAFGVNTFDDLTAKVVFDNLVVRSAGRGE